MDTQSQDQTSVTQENGMQTAVPVNASQTANPEFSNGNSEFGPRRISFLTMVIKTFAGLAGGVAGTLVLLLIFLLTSSILQPVLTPAEAVANEVSPLFIFVLMAMIFSTSIISSLVGPFLMSYSERDRYTRVATALSQIFIVNLVIFAFVVPIYLTISTAHLELMAYAAGLQIILSATASALIFELIHDSRYTLLSVYTTILGVLVASALSFFLYSLSGPAGATILLFASLPVIWTMIGFSQGALGMFYYWLYQNYGIDFLATATSYGADYGIPDDTEEEPVRDDVEGGTFLKQ